MSVRTLTRSFAGGEITPELYGRIDLAKFQTGLALCKNMVVLPHGPVTSRTGFQYVIKAKLPGARLIPFQFNTEQTYIIELGDGYLRVHANGGTVLATWATIVGISTEPQAKLTYLSPADEPDNGDWILISCIDMPEMHLRYAIVSDLNTVTKTFLLKDLYGNYIDSSGYYPFAAGSWGRVFEIATPYDVADVFDINYVQSADVMTLVHPGYPPQELSRISATAFTLTAETYGPSISPPTGVNATASNSGAFDYTYAVTAIRKENFEESLISASDTCSNDSLDITNRYNTITWNAVTGAIRYNVYKEKGGLFGYIGQASGTSFKDDNIQPDYSLTPPEDDDPLHATDEYPGAVSYFEQRKIFGNTNKAPLGYWMTRSGTEKNLTRSLPTRADDSIRGKIVAREVHEIRHFIPLSDLIVLTVGGEWKISSSDNGPLTPNTLQVRPQSYEGCAKIVPQVTGNSVLFVQASKKHVYALGYSWENNAYKSEDISIIAPHLVDSHALVDIAYSKTPQQILWAVRDDGVLLGCTYLPQHEVQGWHQHVTEGKFKSVAVISEGNNYAPYVIVERIINGQTVEYIERLWPMGEFSELGSWFGVDSGVNYGMDEPTTVFSRLWHLEGQQVDVLADGKLVPDITVVDGHITLPFAARFLMVGLPYEPLVKLLPMSFQVEAGGQGLTKNVNKVHLRVIRSSGIKAGPSLDKLRTFTQRTDEPYGFPPRMVSEMIEIPIDGVWGQDGDIYITNEGPLPFTLVSVSAEVELGE